MYTRIHYRLLEGDTWVDSLEINGKSINLPINTLLTHGISSKGILPAVRDVDIPKVDNKIKITMNLCNNNVYDLVLDVSKDDNIQYKDMYIKSLELHLIYRTYLGLSELAFIAQATDQGFYVINFFQGTNDGFMYFMLNNDYNQCYKIEFSYTGDPLNFMYKFKKFLGPDDKELVKYSSIFGVQAADKYRFIKGKESIFAEYPVPFYVDRNKVILCPNLDCMEVLTCFLQNNKPVEYHYTVTKEEE